MLLMTHCPHGRVGRERLRQRAVDRREVPDDESGERAREEAERERIQRRPRQAAMLCTALFRPARSGQPSDTQRLQSTHRALPTSSSGAWP